MSDQSKLGIGKIIMDEQHRDAIHVAVAPVVAGERLDPGDHVCIYPDGTARKLGTAIGVVDPFLKVRHVAEGDTFWLLLYPGSITSLRHEWTHPAFEVVEMSKDNLRKSDSETWMRAWAATYIETGYSYATIDDEGKYQFALKMADEMSVGPNEDCRDHIDNEWWNHWEIITGKTGSRDEYFSCGC